MPKVAFKCNTNWICSKQCYGMNYLNLLGKLVARNCRDLVLLEMGLNSCSDRGQKEMNI